MAPSPGRQLGRAMAASAQELRQRLHAKLNTGSAGALFAVRGSLNDSLDRQVSHDEAADVLAQAVVCAAPIIATDAATYERALTWLARQLAPWEGWALKQ